MSCSNLEDLAADLEKTSVSESGVSFEGRSLKLDTEDDAKQIAEAIEDCKNLEYLNLEGNTLGVDAAKAIAKALEKHPELKRALWKDMFTGRMKTEIPKALQFLGSGLVTAGAHLVELDLSDNAFGPIGVEGLAALLRSSSCYELEELRLNNNGLGITGGKLLANALLDCYNSSKNKGKPLALKVFIAGRNRLENDGATALANVFKTIGTLETIIMPQNGIYHVGISALSEAFTHNKNLTSLNLNDNTIGAKGAEAFVKALPNLQNLKMINFGDCLLKTKGALLLAGGLKAGHKQLEELVLGYNEIKKEGGLALVAAMENKTNLKSIMLDGNQFGKAGRNELQKKMKDIGKFNALGSLNDDESEGSEDEDEGSEESSSDSEDSESEEEQEETVTSEKEEEQSLKQMQQLSLNNVKKIEAKTFIDNPTAENFLNLGENRIDLILSELEKGFDTYLENFVAVLMKISALTKNNKEEVVSASLCCTEKLYRRLFEWAENHDQVSLANNSLLVHLGLIKSEDKKFKPLWNVEGCLFAIESIVKENFVPESTKNALKVFLGKPTENNSKLANAKKRLLSALG